MPLTKNQIIHLKILSLSSDGNGVGRYEGQAVFVPSTAAGDFCEVKIVKLAKSYAFGRLQKVLETGEGRRESDCPVSQSCGGCCFRHLSYEAELLAKQGFVQDALQRLGGLQAPVLPALPSPSINRYRGKVQYPVAADANGGLAYGFYAARSHRLVPCTDCLLQPALLNQIAQQAAALLRAAKMPPYDETRRSGLVRHICLRQSRHNGEVLLTFVLAKPVPPSFTALVKELCSNLPEIAGVYTNLNKSQGNVIFGPNFTLLYGRTSIREVICGVPQNLGPAAFSQVNPAGAEELFALARRMAAVQPDEMLLDLYCGAGVIGLSMAADCRALVGVEIEKEAVQAAKESAGEMGLTNARFICADAAEAARQLAEEGLRPDVAVLDPPRKGCGEAALRPLLQMAPGRVIMVSCNPATLARDLAFLVAHGYEVVQVQPIDLFPRTRHVETCVLLKKQKISYSI